MSTLAEPRRFHNLEQLAPYSFSLRATTPVDGVSAMLRVRNEARKIRCCLGSILDIFDEIVVVDNASDDNTGDLVRAFKRDHDRTDKIILCDYPFRIARCGPEHDAAPEDSVHSLAYYYNSTMAQCSRRYACKWDADMVARREERDAFRRFLEHLQQDQPKAVTISGQTVYRDASARCFLSADETHAEPRLFPNDGDSYYVKVPHFESIRLAPALARQPYDGGIVFYELKFTDEDEFTHWSTDQFPTPRKQREWQRFEAVRTNATGGHGLIPLPPGFLEDQCGRDVRLRGAAAVAIW